MVERIGFTPAKRALRSATRNSPHVVESLEARRLLTAHYYGLTSAAESWQHAENEAIRYGGHLASVTSQAEQIFITRNFLQNNQSRVLWIGLTDKAKEGTFVWSNG